PFAMSPLPGTLNLLAETVAVPVPDQTASTCARAMLEEWVCHYGAPGTIHSDQGANFESQLLGQLCESLNIRKTRTTAYHPSGNGQVESFNKTLTAVIRAHLVKEPDQRRWDEFVAPALMAYRSSVHRGTGLSPFFLLHGREMSLPVDLGVARPLDIEPYCEEVQNLRETLVEAHRVVRERITSYQRVQKDWYDRKVKGREFVAGDEVFVYNPVLKAGAKAKLHSPWTGPAVVLEKLSETRYRIRQEGRRKPIKVVHFNNILPRYRKYPVDGTGGPRRPAPRRYHPGPAQETESVREDSQESDDEDEERWWRHSGRVREEGEPMDVQQPGVQPQPEAPVEVIEGRPQRDRRVPQRYGTPVYY
ncbi:hypothetical protein BOX15_Mlig030754g1, partial [Macrostomum lignano]